MRFKAFACWSVSQYHEHLPLAVLVNCLRPLVLAFARTYALYVRLSYLLYPFMFLSSDYFNNILRVGLFRATRWELLYSVHFGTVVYGTSRHCSHRISDPTEYGHIRKKINRPFWTVILYKVFPVGKVNSYILWRSRVQVLSWRKAILPKCFMVFMNSNTKCLSTGFVWQWATTASFHSLYTSCPLTLVVWHVTASLNKPQVNKIWNRAFGSSDMWRCVAR